MFIATLRVEIVFEAIMSRLLSFASPAKTRSPPFFGHSKCAARAGDEAAPSSAAMSPNRPKRRVSVEDGMVLYSLIAIGFL